MWRTSTPARKRAGAPAGLGVGAVVAEPRVYPRKSNGRRLTKNRGQKARRIVNLYADLSFFLADLEGNRKKN